jgi:hypothetical protein
MGAAVFSSLVRRGVFVAGGVRLGRTGAGGLGVAVVDGRGSARGGDIGSSSPVKSTAATATAAAPIAAAATFGCCRIRSASHTAGSNSSGAARLGRGSTMSTRPISSGAATTSRSSGPGRPATSSAFRTSSRSRTSSTVAANPTTS